MQVNAREFVKRKEQQLPAKYARRSLRQLIDRNASTSKQQLEEINKAYTMFIDMPFEVKRPQA